MILTTLAIASGTLGYSVKVYRDEKRKKEFPWTVAAERMGVYPLVKRKQENRFIGTSKAALRSLSTVIKSKEEQIITLFSDEVSPEEKEVNRYLVYSGVSLALVTGGLWYPVLNVVNAPIFLYTLYPFLVKGYNRVVKDKKVGVAVIDTVATAGPFLLGHFFVASFAVCLINVSLKLILKTEDHSRGSLINIFGEQPRFVWIERNGVEVEILFETLKIGDMVVVQAGQTIVVDGIIAKGMAQIDERALTGESQPVEKGVGERVFASTILLSGQISICVEKTGSETVAAQIGDILNSTADFKSSIVSRGQRIMDLGATPTVALSALSLPFLGVESALAILYASFGYHMRYAAPISVLNFLRMTSESGILVKDGRCLELLSEIDTVVFDKTGTLTEEVPTVGVIHTSNGYTQNELLTYAAAAENKQTHPIARAIINRRNASVAHQNRKLTLPKVSDVRVEVGYGLKVRIGEKQIRVGSSRFMTIEGITIGLDYKKIEEACHSEGHSLVYVALDNQLAGAIELHPTIRPEAQQLISQLHQRNIETYIISGDHQKPTQALAESLGIEHYFAQVLPQDKANLIKQLQNKGKSVCFIGDGINDSIALKTAHVGISMSGASTIATDTAGIILMDGTLKQFIRLLDIANELDANLSRSTIMTVVPGIVCVGGVLFFHFGIVSSLILFNIGLGASVLNALLPLIKHQGDKRERN